MIRVLFGLLVTLLCSLVFAAPALPPLVPEGENLKDFPNWHIDRNTWVYDVAFSPDGNVLASASFEDHSIKLWNANSGKLIKVLQGHSLWVLSVDFSPDGQTIVSASSDNTLKLWDTKTGKLMETLKGHSNSVLSVAFSPNGKTLASASRDNTVKLWDVVTGRLIDTFEGHTSQVNDIAFSPNGQTLASVSSDKTIKLWDTHTSTLLRTLEGHTTSVNSIDFSPDGKILASASTDRTVRLWDINSGELLNTLKQHASLLQNVIFSPNGQTLVATSADGNMTLWDTDTGTRIDSKKGHSHWIYGVSFSPDGMIFASASGDNTLKLWDINSGELVSVINGHMNSVNNATFSPNGQIIASASKDHKVKLWDTNSGQLIKELEGHLNVVQSVTFSPDGQTLSSSSGDGVINLWNTNSGKLINTLEGHINSVNSTAFSPDGQILASAPNGGAIKLWDSKSGKAIKTIERHLGGDESVTFSPNGNILASASSDSTVKLLDTSSGELIYTLDGHSNQVYSVAFSPTETTLASASRDETVKLWDTNSGTLLNTLKGLAGPVNSVAFSPNGKTLASAHGNYTIKLWDANTGKLINTLKGHLKQVNSVEFSPDGETLVSASDDYEVKLWDYKSGRLIRTMVGGQQGSWLTYQPDGTFWRGDRGNLLLTKAGNTYNATLPKKRLVVSDKALKVSTSSITDNKWPSLNIGDTYQIPLTIHNNSHSTLFWIRPEISIESEFLLLDPPIIYKLESGATEIVNITLSAKQTLFATVKPEQVTSTVGNAHSDSYHTDLTIKIVAPKQAVTNITIPVKVAKPEISLAEAAIVNTDQGQVLNVTLQNDGKHWVENTTLSVSVPEVDNLDPITISAKIPAGESITRSFALPDSVPLDKDTLIEADLRTTGLPFLVWDDLQQTVTLPTPKWWMYAALSVLLLASAIGASYFRRYKHPLVVQLSDSPKQLLDLPIDQLSDVKKRLTQTNRLQKVLSDAEVSPSSFDTATGFAKQSSTDKAQQLATRLGAEFKPIEQTLANAPSMALAELRLPKSFPLNLNDCLLCFPEDTAAEDVFMALKQFADAQGRVVLIMGKDSDYQRKLYNTTRDLSNKWVAPQGSEITRLLLSSEPDTTLAEIVSKQLSLQQISPYRIGGGVNNESIFFGRYELISQIVNRDPANYLMVGGRQVGKSSLLKAIERHYADNAQVQCVYLALSNEVLVPRLASMLKLPKTNEVEVLAEAIEERIASMGQRFLFLIDETDRFIAHEPSQDYAVLNVFRRLSEQGQCTFIIAGFWQLYQHAVLDYQSPIRNFGELLSVGELEKPACIELATQPMLTMNLSYANDTLVTHLVESCGQRANLIAIACQHIVRHLPAEQRIIEAGDVHKALTSDEMRRALGGWVVGESDTERAYERMVVYSTIGKDTFNAGELLALAKEHTLNVDSEQLDNTLSRLELSFTLGHTAGKYFYRVPLFMDYIQEGSPEAKLQAELRRLKS